MSSSRKSSRSSRLNEDEDEDEDVGGVLRLVLWSFSPFYEIYLFFAELFKPYQNGKELQEDIVAPLKIGKHGLQALLFLLLAALAIVLTIVLVVPLVVIGVIWTALTRGIIDAVIGAIVGPIVYGAIALSVTLALAFIAFANVLNIALDLASWPVKIPLRGLATGVAALVGEPSRRPAKDDYQEETGLDNNKRVLCLYSLSHVDKPKNNEKKTEKAYFDCPPAAALKSKRRELTTSRSPQLQIKIKA